MLLVPVKTHAVTLNLKEEPKTEPNTLKVARASHEPRMKGPVTPRCQGRAANGRCLARRGRIGLATETLATDRRGRRARGLCLCAVSFPGELGAPPGMGRLL